MQFKEIALAGKEDDMALTGSGTTVDGILESSTNLVINAWCEQFTYDFLPLFDAFWRGG